MNTIVCIKQVPATTKVEIDEKTGVLKRDGIESKINPYDLYAIETALRIRERLGGSVTVVTMGPSQAQAIIKEAYSLGVDNGYIFSDKKFAGADVLATSYTLSQGITAIGKFHLVICGKQTTDGDTAQVGPSIAEFLNIPHATWVKKIETVDNERILVEQDMGDCYEVVELPYPCLITVEKGIFQPRLPSYRKKMQTMNKQVSILTFKEFKDQDEKRYGLNGSPTQVERIFTPHTNIEKEMWEGNSDTIADAIVDMLNNKKFI